MFYLTLTTVSYSIAIMTVTPVRDYIAEFQLKGLAHCFRANKGRGLECKPGLEAHYKTAGTEDLTTGLFCLLLSVCP